MQASAHHQEFLSFLQPIDGTVPNHLAIHLMMDNACSASSIGERTRKINDFVEHDNAPARPLV